MAGQEFRDVDLSGSSFRDVALHDVVMTGVELAHVRIDGEIKDVVINGVDVVPYVEAELDRRDPERPLMRPPTPPASARPGTSSSAGGARPSRGPAGSTPRCWTSPSTASGPSSRRCGT